MIDEPADLSAELSRWQRHLLGAILIKPSAIASNRISALDVSELNEPLSRVLATLRLRPAISVADLIGECLTSRGDRLEAMDAIRTSVPWLADWYASRVSGLLKSRREFWDAARILYEAQLRAQARADSSMRR